ncbi:MAG TPA: hypothetical protein VMK65_01030 [Longimicrobiales bacterium]|nr:hypothetical protein [Longimicrobiales bacterium]
MLTLLALGACERASAPGTAEAGGEEEPAAPALALYRRELLFLPAGEEGGAVVLTAQVRPAADRALRGTHAWLRRGGEWTPLLQDQWEAAPLRQPWRILPHGTLRVLVEDGGELESLIFGRAADAPRLNQGPVSGEWTSGPQARVLLREGELLAGAAAAPGLVLDVELGATALPATPMGAALFLIDGDGTAVAALRLPEGELRLLTFAGALAEEEALVRLERAGAGWRLVDAEGGDVLAELQGDRAAADPDTVADPHALPTRPPATVRGWLRNEEGRRDVRGLLLGEAP